MKELLAKIKEQEEKKVTVYMRGASHTVSCTGVIRDFDDMGIVMENWEAVTLIPWTHVYRIALDKD